MRTTWSNVMNRRGSFFLLVGRIDDSSGDGPKEEYDRYRLRFAIDLLKRCCTALALEGSYAIMGSRSSGVAQVHVAVERQADHERLAVLGPSEPLPAPPSKARSEFVLTESLHEQFLGLAGPSDNRGAGRRAHLRKEGQDQDRSLRWNIGPGRGRS